MALICKTVTTWITETVLDEVDTFVSQQQQQCSNYPWPLNWVCKAVTVLIKVTSWVARNILVPVLTTVCVLVTFLIGSILYPFAWAIDAVCQTCNAHSWVELWFLTPTKITLVSQVASNTTPGSTDYTFTCHCKNGDKDIVVTATNDVDAAKFATVACRSAC